MLKHCFYINLERREDRKVFIENELSKSDILKNIIQRFDAVDGYKIHPRFVEEGVLTENAIQDILMDTVTMWGLSLTQGGLGVLLSYRGLFKKISEMDSTVITFEDDTVLEDDFDNKLRNVIENLPSDFDMCYLGHGGTIETEHFNDYVSIPKGVITCLPSLLISPKGAKKLYDLLVNIDNQIDTALYTRLDQIEAYVVREKLVSVKNEFTTDIQGNNSCKKNYEKQNYIFTTLCVGVQANLNAIKLAKDLEYFKQRILIVTDQKEMFDQLSNVILIDYPNKRFSYNDKIICFEEGFKISDAVVYIDSDCRVFYKTYKQCYTNFFRIVEPGFHKSWVWGKVSRQDGGFFNSTDVGGRVNGYGELALSTCVENDIPIEDAEHHQEGIIIISKDNGKEKILLETWKKLSSVLDDYEIKNGSERIGVGEGNLLGLSIVKSGITQHDPMISNHIGEDIKYNFYGGGQMEDYLKQYPDRKLVKITDEEMITSKEKIEVNFKDKIVLLSYKIYKSTDKIFTLRFEWDLNDQIEFLDHEFKVDELVYHFNSDKSGEFIFTTNKQIEIYHTYDWYGNKEWKLIQTL